MRYFRSGSHHYVIRVEADGYSLSHNRLGGLTPYHKGDREWLEKNTQPTTPLYALLRTGDAV